VKRYRDKQKSVTQTPQNVTQSPESVTRSLDNVTQYPAILLALVDPVKRKKLEAIVLEMKRHHVSEHVRYGIAGPTFDVVGELLEVT